MLTPALACRCGDVYAYGDRLYLLLACTADRMASVPIVHHNQALVRNDLLLRNMDDLAACGIGGGLYLIRPAGMGVWPRVRAARLGGCPELLMAAVMRRVDREIADRRVAGVVAKARAWRCLA